FATGERTIFGKLAHDISHNDVKNTTFDVGIKNVSKLLIIMTAIIAPLVFIINGITKGDWVNALIFSIATAVGLTPEMLPVIVTTNLVKGSIEMSKKGTIVKKMNSIQNFGSADILCTDKTGTLTQDKVVLERHYDLNLRENPRILELGYLNSNYQTGMKNLIDKAIIEAAADELDISEIQRDYNKIDEIPFDFSRRRMSVVVENSDEQH
ncbi:MAG: HAD-IC family P-type ATPase, partial [Gilliamella apis]|nr:HAD-IC family P-type ATPase [Gilliamella apis]